MFKGHFIVLQYAPFRHAKWPILGCEMVLFSLWNGLYRTAKWALSESETNVIGLWYGVYHKTIRAETAFIISVLTFLYTSFAKIFCQNLVKKNCKFVSRFFIKNTDIRHEGKHKNRVSVWWRWFIGCGNFNLSLYEYPTVTGQTTHALCGNICLMSRKHCAMRWLFSNKTKPQWTCIVLGKIN